jgi:glyoxylase-like metal-dependent hydrolase (beta-lactamase superfamily II)
VNFDAAGWRPAQVVIISLLCEARQLRRRYCRVAADAAKRDAERIMAAAKDARISHIDHLITTHWHGDHFGGMVEMAY